MPTTVRPTSGFLRLVSQQFQPVERASISSLLQDLDDYGLPTRDPDLFVLDRNVPIASRQVPGLEVGFYVLPARISTAPFRSRTMWFGLCVIEDGDVLLNGRVLVLKVWTDDQGIRLVAAQDELKGLVAAEFP